MCWSSTERRRNIATTSDLRFDGSLEATDGRITPPPDTGPRRNADLRSRERGLCPCDFRVGPFHVHKRPHLDEFLSRAGRHYKLAIWSSASSDYVAAIAQHILPRGFKWAFVWSRERCTVKRNLETFEADYVKDLKKVKRLGYDLARILVVDDTRCKTARNYGNAIYIEPFVGDPGDEELRLLLEYLESLVGCQNFRSIEKRDWRTRITHLM